MAEMTLVRFVVAIRNMLPDNLARLYAEHGDRADAEQAADDAEEHEGRALILTRDIEMSAVPRVGDSAYAHNNFSALEVVWVTWHLSAPDGAPVVWVGLSDLDEDEGDLFTLLEAGWAVDFDDLDRPPDEADDLSEKP